MALIGWAGFIVAGKLFVEGVARGFGSRRIARDIAIAGSHVGTTCSATCN